MLPASVTGARSARCTIRVQTMGPHYGISRRGRWRGDRPRDGVARIGHSCVMLSAVAVSRSWPAAEGESACKCVCMRTRTARAPHSQARARMRRVPVSAAHAVWRWRAVTRRGDASWSDGSSDDTATRLHVEPSERCIRARRCYVGIRIASTA